MAANRVKMVALALTLSISTHALVTIDTRALTVKLVNHDHKINFILFYYDKVILMYSSTIVEIISTPKCSGIRDQRYV